MEKFKETKIASFLGIFGNIFLLIIKGGIGISFHSQAMVADAVNSAGDIFASLMTYIGNRISSVPHDEDHNFGHGKAEYLFSMFISISMLIAATKLFYDSIQKLINGSDMQFSWLLVVVCITTIITKLLLYLYTKHLYKKHSSLLLKANMEDHRNDCFITIFTLISVLLSLKGFSYFDNIVSIGISAWICYTGITIFIESYNILMDISIDKKTYENIENTIKKHSEVIRIVNISSTPIGAQYIVFIKFAVDGNMSTFDSHRLADTIEKEVSKSSSIYQCFAHVEPE